MKTKRDDDAVAAVERARNELEQAEIALAGFDAFKGTLDDAAARRRALQDRAAIARERLKLAQDRAAVAADAETETEIAILIEQSNSIEAEIEGERERVGDELHKIFLGDWLDGAGRFSSSQPQGRGLVSMASSVLELEEKRAQIVNQIARLQGRLVEKKSERDRQAAAARVELRKRLLAGERVSIPLTAWRLFPLEGYSSETASVLHNRKIPVSIVPGDDRQLHCLIPAGSTPAAWMSAESLLRFEEMDPDDLTPTMAEIWKRSR